MKYRAEIDGLRAFAVMPVILFHADFELFNGGFVGVDIFFVISGYLITTILIEDIESDRFNIIKFYERRARRILPALFLVTLFCIPLAWAWLLPNQMKDFSQSLVAVSFFVSNILFWRESGYFDTTSQNKPLLHTWSLAVEEQYYFLFPIFLIFTWRFGKNRVFWLIFVMALISLFLSEWGWRNKAVANFYLAPTRAWEILSGSIASFIIKNKGLQSSNTLASLGLAAIVFAIFAYDNNTPFPSVYTLLPVLGALLLILYADRNTLAAKFLSTKILVGMGLISYSAYLWHQPLFAFVRIRLIEKPPALLMASLCLATVMLAFLSWRFVEKPVRYNKIWSRKRIFFVLCAGIVVISCFGGAGHITNGFEKRFSPTDRQFLAQINGKNSEYTTARFNALKLIDWQPNKKKILLVGDSYAQDLANAIYESGLDKKFSVSTWHYISANCGNLFAPTVLLQKFIDEKNKKNCSKTNYYENDEFASLVELADEVWFASHWQAWQIELLVTSLKNMDKLSPAKSWIFGRKDFPNFKPHVYLGLSAEERARITEPLDNEHIQLNKQFLKLTRGYNIIDVQSILCGGNALKCKMFDDQGFIKTYDGGHLTQSGAKFYGEALKRMFFSNLIK